MKRIATIILTISVMLFFVACDINPKFTRGKLEIKSYDFGGAFVPEVHLTLDGTEMPDTYKRSKVLTMFVPNSLQITAYFTFDEEHQAQRYKPAVWEYTDDTHSNAVEVEPSCYWYGDSLSRTITISDLNPDMDYLVQCKYDIYTNAPVFNIYCYYSSNHQLRSMYTV